MSDVKITVGGNMENDVARRFSDAWRRAALFLDRPYSDAGSRWGHDNEPS